jgi:3',5'-cyclic-AMP phosphodiesterase
MIMAHTKLTARRDFLRSSIMASCGISLSIPALCNSARKGKLRIGMISDVHQDVMHDAEDRLRAFIDAMRVEKPDLIFQLGDFCQPIAKNKPFMELWKSHDGPRFHVLGNHDMDGGFTREQTVAWYEMPSRYYSFEQGGVKFIVLDGNDPQDIKGGYHRFIAKEQQNWLDAQLEATTLPVIVLVHQPLDLPGGVSNQIEIRSLLEKNRGAGKIGVIAVFAGHLHQDSVNRMNGIPYVQINSSSYVWLPNHARREVYAKNIHQSHPHLAQVAPYREPLWAMVTLDFDAGQMTIVGRETEWVGPDPWQRGVDEKSYPRNVTKPAVSAWTGPFSANA